MEINQSTNRGRWAAAGVLIMAATAMLLAALAFSPVASAEAEDEPRYARQLLAAVGCDVALPDNREWVEAYSGFGFDDGRRVVVCWEAGFEPVKYESQCIGERTWRADFGACLDRRIRDDGQCNTPPLVLDGNDCWTQLLTDRHLDPVVDPGDGGGTDPEPDPGNGGGDTSGGDDNDADDNDADDNDDKGDQSEGFGPAPALPVCIEDSRVQDNPDVVASGIGDTFDSPDGGRYVIVAGDMNGCSFGCIDGWDANCDGRIGDFCLSEHDRFTVLGVWQCLRHLSSTS